MDNNIRVNPRIEDMDPERTEVEEFLQVFHGKWYDGAQIYMSADELTTYYEHGTEMRELLEEGWDIIYDISGPGDTEELEGNMRDRNDPRNWIIVAKHMDYSEPIIMNLGVAKIICPHFIAFSILAWREDLIGGIDGTQGHGGGVHLKE